MFLRFFFTPMLYIFHMAQITASAQKKRVQKYLKCSLATSRAFGSPTYHQH